MAHAGGHTHDHGDVVRLGKLESTDDEVACFLAVRRLQQRNVSSHGMVARVLLVLGAVHTGVVGHQVDQTAGDSRVRLRVESVRGNVEADVLHRDQHARSAERDPARHLGGDLLVRSPFAVHPVVTHEVLEHLCGWRTGVTHANHGAGFPRAAGDRLVTRHQGTRHEHLRTDRVLEMR